MDALLADLVLVVHVAFIAFVVVALPLTLVGAALRWGWVRNGWFRFGHLAAIGIVVAQAWLGIMCPLTTLEAWLRERAGQEPYSSNGFIADWLHRLFFFEAEPWVFVVIYTVFGALVAATWWCVPVGRRGRAHGVPPAKPQAAGGAA